MLHKKVPIFLYHSVSDDINHPWSFLSLPISVFEKQLRYLSKNGFKTLTLSELYGMDEGDIPDKAVVLTFDDGYLDNWVFAYPLLKKHGAKATYFVNPEFVDPTNELRKTLDDVWSGDVSLNDLAGWGFASWHELKKMSDEGSVDIQSHGMTHAIYFSSNRVIDFHHQGAPYFWLKWNLMPEKKPFWLNTDSLDDNIPYGYPVYEFGRGFVTRRYFDDKKVAAHLTDYVKGHGGSRFFKESDWKSTLMGLYQDYVKEHPLSDRTETKEEFLSRVKDELVNSKHIIEKHIKKPVNFMCWPFGEYNEEVHAITVKEAGYRATIAVVKDPLPARSDLLGRVSFGQDYQGPFRKSLYYLKFISSVETMAGTGIRHILIRLYQLSRISKIYHRFLRTFFKWR